MAATETHQDSTRAHADGCGGYRAQEIKQYVSRTGPGETSVGHGEARKAQGEADENDIIGFNGRNKDQSEDLSNSSLEDVEDENAGEDIDDDDDDELDDATSGSGTIVENPKF